MKCGVWSVAVKLLLLLLLLLLLPQHPEHKNTMAVKDRRVKNTWPKKVPNVASEDVDFFDKERRADDLLLLLLLLLSIPNKPSCKGRVVATLLNSRTQWHGESKSSKKTYPKMAPKTA